MALTKSVTAVRDNAAKAVDNAAKAVQEERALLMLRFALLTSCCKAAISECKDALIKEYEMIKAKGVTTYASEKYAQIKATASKPEVKVTGLSALGGAIAMGASSGLTGMTGGAGVGAIVGVVPAVFTFGLSIPIGAIIGGGIGLVAGTTVGSSAGFVGGGAVGYYTYQHRNGIKGAANYVSDKMVSYKIAFRTTVSEKYAQIKAAASKPEVKVTGLSAVGGAVAIGASGGMTGMATCAGVGAIVGVVPAIFTFGLSIPVSAFVGGTFGLFAGTAVGGSTGLVGGGAVGYYGYQRRDEIKGAAKCVSDKASSYTSAFKGRFLALE